MNGFNIFDYIADEYELLSKMEYSGSSNLFLLYDKTCGRKVLLKSGRVELIENEAQTLSKISGEGIPEIYQCFEQEGTAYLFRQYIEGRTLRQYLEHNQAFTEEQTAEIGIIICKIISRLHKYNPPVIHRDIKLDNIILTNDGKIYIIDWGISREFNPSGLRDTVVMGTSSIAPPEQFGYRQTDVRSDIYSIGVLLHEMITGETALNKGKYSRKISYIIKKCTMFSPDDRYHNADDIAKALKKFLDRRKKFTKVLAVCSIFSVFLIFLGACLSKINTFSESDMVYFMAINDSYSGKHRFSKNIPKHILEKFDNNIRLTLKIEADKEEPWVSLVPMGYMGEKAEIVNLVEGITCSYERNPDGFMVIDSKQTECVFTLSHDIITELHEKGIYFQATNATVQYAILSNASLNNEFFLDHSLMDSLKLDPLEAKYSFHFNDVSGNAVPVVKGRKNMSSEYNGAELIEDPSKKVKFAEGKLGEALYLDGSYGLHLPVGELGSSYTIAFWVKTLKEMTNFMPVLQAGITLEEGISEKWLNITKVDFEGNASPAIWSKDDKYYEHLQDDFYWPYYIGKDENNMEIITPENGWQHIIVTVDATEKLNLWDENVYSSKSTTYVNGEFYSTGVVADDIFDANVTVYLGINPWDDLFTGYIDELRFYDMSITADQAKKIFAYDEEEQELSATEGQ